MKGSATRFWLALASAALVLGLAAVDLRGKPPGPLAIAHGRVPDLAAGGACSACHGGFLESMAEACLECHAEIESDLERADGLHGAIDPTQARACSLCHGEHHGTAFQLVNVQSFVLSTSRTPEEFDHGILGVELSGAHLELGCAECHLHADADVLPVGESRFRGLTLDCASCHEDPHGGAMPLACSACHVQAGFDQNRSVGHESFLHLGGGHAGVSCRECHQEGGEHALELDGGGEDARSCRACHATGHTAGFLAGTSRAGEEGSGEACRTCHRADHEGFGASAQLLSAQEHAFTGFALDAPHAQASCEACHGPSQRPRTERFPGRGREECAACHADPHGGQFVDAPVGSRDCVDCHALDRFEPHEFGAEEHAGTRLALIGSHLESNCEACHVVPAEDRPRIFHGTPSSCSACHADAHDGFFDAPDGARASGGTCDRCHTSTRFADLDRESFAHGRWTGVPVLGAHAEEGCELCHAPRASPDARGRSFGSVSEVFGAYVGCATCHDDPHGGRFDGEGLPATVEARSGCARCHQQSSFRATRGSFDHGLWAGFALEGAHARTACSSCHALPLDARESGGRSGGRSGGDVRARPAPGTRCADCHADPHAGQFTEGGRSSCERCHAGARSFSDLRFDHERDTDFPLGRGHRALACDACHLAWSYGEAEIVRYRGLGTDCSDCHGVHRDVLDRGWSGSGRVREGR